MELSEAIKNRHSVRQYKDMPIEADALSILQAEVNACNAQGGLHIQLVTNEPKAFGGLMARSFSGVSSYFALIGPKSDSLDELCGYYGERLVLKAQQLGLNTCWVALTYKKVAGAYQINSREKLVAVIALGYGQTQGTAHKSKPAEAVSNLSDGSPAWFRAGVEAALLAPTAVNQQKFILTRTGDKVDAEAGKGAYSKMDLGIVKYHFELGSGKDSSVWA